MQFNAVDSVFLFPLRIMVKLAFIRMVSKCFLIASSLNG
jgi:hypothetical protein